MAQFSVAAAVRVWSILRGNIQVGGEEARANRVRARARTASLSVLLAAQMSPGGRGP